MYILKSPHKCSRGFPVRPIDRSAIAPLLLAFLVPFTLTVACTKVPFTDRRQFDLVPDAIMIPLGAQAYESTLTGVQVTEKGDNAEEVSTVGRRIAKVADNPDYDWEFALIKDASTINAWCLPGGKVAVYTGLLPVAQNEAGLAFIVGHEVGHAMAHHSAERLTQQLTVLGGIAGLNLYLSKKTAMTDEQRTILLAGLGLGAEVGMILPFSRLQESEADVIGMMYMAAAGYPPDESIAIWDRMEQATGGSSLPTFLSTHPSNSNRQANLNDWMNRAKKRYTRNALDRDTTSTLWK